MNDYASQLKAVEDALDDTVGDTWDLTLDPISLQVYDTHFYNFQLCNMAMNICILHGSKYISGTLRVRTSAGI